VPNIQILIVIAPEHFESGRHRVRQTEFRQSRPGKMLHSGIGISEQFCQRTLSSFETRLTQNFGRLRPDFRFTVFGQRYNRTNDFRLFRCNLTQTPDCVNPSQPGLICSRGLREEID